MKINTAEPADRPLSASLSHAEIITLVNYHVAQSRRIVKATGKLLLEKRSLFGGHKQQKALIRYAKRLCDAHIARATGLQSICRNTPQTKA
jgi:hypothetical protein